MTQRGWSRGFTLIELLVVVAIIATLAALLFPVFARAREKARESVCINHQRQIAVLALLHAQDHEETLPAAETFWPALHAPPTLLRCPSAPRTLRDSYIANPNAAGKALGDIPAPSTTWLTTDGANNQPDRRHHGHKVSSYVDGHVDILDIRESGPRTIAGWGANGQGELGNNSTTNVVSPFVSPTGLGSVRMAAMGYRFTLAVKADGTVWAWGNNAAGQLGDGTTTQRTTPVQVSGLTEMVAVAAGVDQR
jgi:prepilin-type N-terminal cleavage/methylation domain-containing protein